MQHTFDEFDNNGSTVFVCTEAWLGQVFKIEAMQGSAEPFLTQVHRAHRKAGFEPTHYASRVLEDCLKVVVITLRTTRST